MKKSLLYDNSFEYETSEEVTVYPNFESMGLKEELIRGMKFKFKFIKDYMLMVLIKPQLYNKELLFQLLKVEML